MADKKIKPERLQLELSEALQYYDMQLQAETQKAIDIEARGMRDDLKTNSPKESGEYRKGWSLKRNFRKGTRYSVTVHNKKRYQLVHLLEHGRGEGHIAARPHVFTAFERAESRLERRLDDLIGSW